jgi:hypothetical protein
MTEEFDRSGVALLTANPTTVYQVPGDTAGATSLVLSCLAAHVADSNATASIELRIVSPAGQVLGTPVRRALIGPGMAVELVPNRHVLGPGERVQAIASPGGLLSILISVLGPELSPNRRRIANVEAYARFIPPETVGSNKNIVNVGSVVEADVTFRAPAIRIGVVVRPPALAVTAGPVVPALAFGAVTIDAPSRSIALSAGVPFVGSAVEAVVVPKAELTLTAAAPVVATGSGVVVPVAQITLSAPVPSVVTTAALDSDAAAYIAAVEAADGQSLEVDVKTAINNFIVGCKADGIWTALKASCILSGARTLSGALVPLVGTAPTNFNFWGDADPHWANVSLLLRMNGANASTTFTDSSSNALTVTRSGSAQISTAQSRFGGASAAFPGGISSWLTAPNVTALTLGAADFTIEMWCYPNTVSGEFLFWNGNIDAYAGARLIQVGSTSLVLLCSTNGTAHTTNIQVDNVLSVSAWQHVAISKSGSTLRVFVNGLTVITTTIAASLYNGGINNIGGRSAFPASFDGYIDDLRITKGVARYTANFTPPTQTFPGATADYDRKTGLVGDGSTKYLNSNRNNNADPQNNNHLALYGQRLTSSDQVIIGGRDGNSGDVGSRFIIFNTSLSIDFASNPSTDTRQTGTNVSVNGTSFYGLSRSVSASYTSRSASTSTSHTQTSGTPVDRPLSIFVLNNANTNGSMTPVLYSPSRLAFYSIGESLDLALLDARVGRLVAETAFAINTGLDGSTYDIDTLKYINAGYAAGGSLS